MRQSVGIPHLAQRAAGAQKGFERPQALRRLCRQRRFCHRAQTLLDRLRNFQALAQRVRLAQLDRLQALQRTARQKASSAGRAGSRWRSVSARSAAGRCRQGSLGKRGRRRQPTGSGLGVVIVVDEMMLTKGLGVGGWCLP